MKYVKNHHIGEEIDEPLGNSTDEEIEQMQRQASPYDVEHIPKQNNHGSSV